MDGCIPRPIRPQWLYNSSATFRQSSTSNQTTTRGWADRAVFWGDMTYSGWAEPSKDRNEGQDEARKIRRLQVMINMVMSVIGQDPNLTLEEASELAAGAKRAALAMFPDKELAFDLLYKPRLQRLMNERFHLQ